MFDSHCHLNFKAFKEDADAVATEMATHSISGLVVGCDRTSSKAGIELAENHKNLWASVGLHPVHVLDDPWDQTTMSELAQNPKVVAIGEVGLDFFRNPEDPNLKESYLQAQYHTFRSAIKLAQQTNKPLVIHSREAYDEIIKVLAEFFEPAAEPTRGTIHCFMGTPEQAEKLLALGFMIGFTGVITYKDVAATLIEAASQVPLDRILIETDAPYLTPEPYRSTGRKQTGKTPRNLPAYSYEVAVKLAELHQKTPNQVVEITENNAKRLFLSGI